MAGTSKIYENNTNPPFLDQIFPLQKDLSHEQVNGNMKELKKDKFYNTHKNLISSNFSKSVDTFNKFGMTKGPMLKYQRSNTPEFKNTQASLKVLLIYRIS